MTVALVVAATELRRRLRDRSALLLGLAAPFGLATILGLALGSGEEAFTPTIVVADDDGRPSRGERGAQRVGEAFVEGITAGAAEEAGGPRFEAARSGVEARRRVERDDAAAAVIVPQGFEASLTEAEPRAVRVLRRADRPLSGGVADAVASGLASAVEGRRLAVRVALAETPRPLSEEEVEGVIEAAGEAAGRIAVSDDRTDLDGVELVSYFGPAMGVLFLFFTVGAGARSLLAERRDGTLARLQAAPIHPASVLLGKVLAVVASGMVGLLTLWGATTFAFGATWGDPLAVLALCLATVVSVGGVVALVSSLVRTEEAADGLSSVVAFVFALVGGNFFPPGDARPALEAAGRLTPNGWALQAFTELSFDGAGIGVIAGSLGVLVLIGVVTGGLALVRFRGLVAS